MTVQIPEAFKELFTPSRYKAYYGGRGSAKSHSFATAAVLRATLGHERILCGREIQKSIRESVKRLLDDKIDACGLREHFKSTDTEIKGPNESVFIFAGLRTNPDTIKSTEGITIAWIEEANTVSQNSLEILIPTVRRPKSELWFNWNPRFPTDPVDAMFRGGEPPPDSIIREVGFEDNPFFPDVLRQEMEWDKRRDPDKYAHIWLGKYRRNSEGRVFKNWRIDNFDTPYGVHFLFGADWGFSIDPTVLVRCFVDGRTLYIDREVRQIGCEIDKTPALFDKIEDSRKFTIRADSARPETISYMQRQGFNIVAAKKGKGSVEDGIEFLKSYDIVVHPSCKHTIDELSLYSYETDKLTNEVLPMVEDKNNHVIDALRYAVESVRRATEPRVRAL